ncbi:MAG: aminopeptidase P N-terminal domain-containing protein, partial [Flavobacteriales bacterium]
EILFVQPKNPAVELWSGRRMGVDMAGRLLGIQAVLPNTAFSDMSLTFKEFDKITYTPLSSGMQDDPRDRGDLSSLYKHFREKISPVSASVDVVFLHDKLAAMRQVKQQEELNLMIKAIDITCNAHRELMKAVEPGMYEYQAQAIIEYKFKTGGAEHPAFESICGSGENTCVLHYSTNRRQLNMGDLMVVDVGAEYHGYCADVTRTIPVSGTFSNDQKLIYEIVLAAQKAGIAQCRAGKKFWEPNDAAKEIIANGLLQLGIIHSKSEYHKYFMHGTSHYLGLDVHDVGQFNYLMKGNVITVEPGIYIPEGSDCDQRWWNIGVRIEDDVLITGGEPEVLSSSAPKEITAVEELMRQTSPLRPVH